MTRNVLSDEVLNDFLGDYLDILRPNPWINLCEKSWRITGIICVTFLDRKPKSTFKESMECLLDNLLDIFKEFLDEIIKRSQE